jgi:hypothetical protein
MLRFAYAAVATALLGLPAGGTLRACADGPPCPQGSQRVAPQTSRAAVEALERYLSLASDARTVLGEQMFAGVPLTRTDATEVQRLLWQDHERMIRQTRAAEFDER